MQNIQASMKVVLSWMFIKQMMDHNFKMKTTKINSYNSTPHHSGKENQCPNLKINSHHPQPLMKRTPAPSMGTDSDFSVFNTINVQGKPQIPPSSGSRREVQGIIEQFTPRDVLTNNTRTHQHRSFVELLGMAMGRDRISVEEAIEKCEEYEITSRNQLISIMEEKEPTRQWPLPLSNLLLTDLGHLKVTRIAQRLQKDADLSENQLQIVEFLLPKSVLVSVDSTTLMDCYHEYRNSIDEKFGKADQLVQQYTLRVQPKIRAQTDRVQLVKVEKRIKHLEKVKGSKINFGELRDCLGLIGITGEQDIITIFKYLYFLDTDKVMTLADRSKKVSCENVRRELINIEEEAYQFGKPAISTIEGHQQQNNQVINGLLQDKEYLLNTIDHKNSQINKLKEKVALMKLQRERQTRLHEKEKSTAVECLRSKLMATINGLKEENMDKDVQIEWYRNQLEAVINENNLQMICSRRHQIYRQAHNGITTAQSVSTQEGRSSTLH